MLGGQDGHWDAERPEHGARGSSCRAGTAVLAAAPLARGVGWAQCAESAGAALTGQHGCGVGRQGAWVFSGKETRLSGEHVWHMGHILAFISRWRSLPGRAGEGHLEVKRESEHHWALFLRLPQEGSGKLRGGCC